MTNHANEKKVRLSFDEVDQKEEEEEAGIKTKSNFTN